MKVIFVAFLVLALQSTVAFRPFPLHTLSQSSQTLNAKATYKIRSLALYYSSRDYSLILAVEEGNENIAIDLINQGTDINTKGLYYDHPSKLAKCPNINTIEDMLVSEFILIRLLTLFISYLTDIWGDTPLILASQRGSDKIAMALIAKRCDLNIKDEQGYTALMCSTLEGHEMIALDLILYGADLNCKDRIMGTTALILAAKYGRHKIAMALIDKGADLTIQDSFKKTALMYALENDNSLLARALVQKGAK